MLSLIELKEDWNEHKQGDRLWLSQADIRGLMICDIEYVLVEQKLERKNLNLCCKSQRCNCDE